MFGTLGELLDQSQISVTSCGYYRLDGYLVRTSYIQPQKKIRPVATDKDGWKNSKTTVSSSSVLDHPFINLLLHKLTPWCYRGGERTLFTGRFMEDSAPRVSLLGLETKKKKDLNLNKHFYFTQLSYTDVNVPMHLTLL